jgi:hypothetical protein
VGSRQGFSLVLASFQNLRVSDVSLMVRGYFRPEVKGRREIGGPGDDLRQEKKLSADQIGYGMGIVRNGVL